MAGARRRGGRKAGPLALATRRPGVGRFLKPGSDCHAQLRAALPKILRVDRWSFSRTPKPAGESMNESRTCQRCGRAIEWRRKWAKVWESIRYCSDACRRHRPGAVDHAIEERILALLATRPKNATICPSEAARAEFPRDWRDRMEQVRQAARRLVANGRIEITRQGRVVDPSSAKGPIRLRRARGFPKA
jgi:hypothetical protein